ncbi:MAG: GGDEF domain-containing protein, partial [Oscillospiraceae bacterium]|nr:GGDEF domain-containing protein [Oscillospiraceae bacterium]
IKGHLHSTNRLTGYYEALIEHNIPIDRSRVFYGDFWYDKGEEVVQALVDDGRPMPQAIACASDTMAISVCEALKARGYKIPEDIAVTGYDSIEAGINYVPGITSSDIPADDTGRRAARLMHSLISGTKFTDNPRGAEITIGKSCGCSRNAAEEMRKKLRTWQDEDAFGNFNSAYNFMLESLISEKDLEKYIHALAWHTFHIGKNSTFYLALCDDWDNLGENDLNLQYRKEGYSKTMTLPLRKMGENARVNPELTFELSDMLPMIYERRPKPTAFFFGPVHFNKRCFGYSVFSYGDDTAETYPSCYRQWMKYVCVSLESLRRHRNLMYLYKKMEDNAVTDLLTGIYNRNGFNLYTEDIIKSVKNKGENLIVILGDMNNLKYINDTFGHIEGDFAIKSVAEAFKEVCFNEACGNNYSCFRIGGDEYVLIGGTNSAEEEIDRISASIVRHLKIVNDTADKPYSISVSIGSFFGSPEEYDTIEKPIAIADERMFEAKQKFKRDENFDYRRQRSESHTDEN